MKRLQKTKPSGRGIGIALPLAGGTYYPMVGNMYWHHDDFLGATLDTDEWVSSAGFSSTGVTATTATITVTGGLATITGSTATAGTLATRFYTIETGNQNVFYTIPFRVDVLMRIDSLTSGQNARIRVRDTGATHFAEFHFSATAIADGPNALTARTNAGSTAAGYINSAAVSFFATANAGISAYNHYIIELGHRGVWFGINPEADSNEPPRMLKFFGTNLPRHDLNYVVEIRQDVASGDTVAGTRQTIDVDSISVEQLAPAVQQERAGQMPGNDLGSTRSLALFQSMVSNAISLATTGAGVFLGFSYATSAVNAGVSDVIAAYDASAAGVSFIGGDTATSRLIWLQNVIQQGTATAQLGSFSQPQFPANGIPFYRGLVIGTSGLFPSAGAGSTSITVVPVWRSQV